MATFIYVMSTPGKVKVGKARDPKRRLASLQTGNPEEIRLIRLYQCPNEEAASQLERVCHEQISKYHYRGEWFKEACLPEVDKFLAAQKYKQAPIMVRQDIKRKEIKGLSGSELKYLYNWSYKDFSDRIRSRPTGGSSTIANQLYTWRLQFQSAPTSRTDRTRKQKP